MSHYDRGYVSRVHFPRNEITAIVHERFFFGLAIIDLMLALFVLGCVGYACEYVIRRREGRKP